MGQYQQWLHHRAVDQQLQGQLARLEQELQQLQGQIEQAGDITSCSENPIIQAIAMQQSAESLFVDTSDLPPIADLFSSSTTDEESAGESVSPALFAWGRLPNLDTQNMPAQATQLMDKEPEGGTVSYAEATLLPEDMASFIDIHTATIPRLHTPSFTQTVASSAKNTDPEAVSDDRIDYLIQRWQKRWGRDISDDSHTSKPREDTVP